MLRKLERKRIDSIRNNMPNSFFSSYLGVLFELSISMTQRDLINSEFEMTIREETRTKREYNRETSKKKCLINFILFLIESIF